MVAVQTQSLFFLISVDDCDANVMGGFDQKSSYGLFIKRNKHLTGIGMDIF